MGALTSNRKRGDGSTFHRNTFSSLRFPDRDCQAHTPVTKKLKFTYMHQSQNQIDAWKSTFSRFSKYPEVVTTLRREVHAPCRIRKFGISAGSCRNWKFGTAEIREKEDFKGTMGNFLCRYNCAKSRAMNSLQFYPKDKDIIDVDAEPVIHLDAGTAIQEGSEDSSIEEVEAVEHRREGLSAVLDQASPESNGTRAFPAPEAKSVSMETVSVESNHFQQSPAPMIPDSINGNGIVEVENAKKMMDLLCISREESVARHEKLRMILQRRDCKLDNLTFQIALQEKRWALLQLLRPAKKRDEKVPEEAFVPLTQEEEAEVSRAFSANRRRVLVAHATSNIEITGEILQCLRPGAWLNDEVINVYLELLKEREKREPKKYLKCHFFNTFFYKKLTSGRGGCDYKSVRRWTSQRKLGYNLTECDKIFIPIHKEVHWCLAVINQKDEKFQYLDSLGGRDMHVLKVLARYFVDEVKEKTGKEIDVSSWEQEFVEDLPEQKNGWDCGMFMIKYADFYSRGFGLCFNQEHMLYFRKRTVKEILRLKAD